MQPSWRRANTLLPLPMTSIRSLKASSIAANPLLPRSSMPTSRSLQTNLIWRLPRLSGVTPVVCGFMVNEPLGQWRRITIAETRTKKDWARQIQLLLELDYPDAEKVILACDNLNTHVLGAFYATFPPEKARNLLSWLEIHYTPKRGSWLNIAEIELSVLTRQCLGRRIPTLEALRAEIAIWNQKRNQRQKSVDWQFITSDARRKIKRLYQMISENRRRRALGVFAAGTKHLIIPIRFRRGAPFSYPGSLKFPTTYPVSVKNSIICCTSYC